ncbi:N-acetylmuramoyl-L-alanine amidase [Virgibacillus ndiopensis]|uniref:N-acetylmuramoyl-L-alanine amidase n=1 Tax=Virgibacillus ndiopensis TaxID=2004408 RepID=UPI000C06E704|nr:N-acetylmuramoyl-L-alanine amidase [Virgibacillus ndiopensis]
MIVKQMFTVGISFLLFLIIFVSPVHAEDGNLYEVGTDTLEMVDAPAKDAEVIGQLVRGDMLTTFQEKFGWVQTYYNGKEVWVASQYLIPIDVEPQTNKKEQDSNEKSESQNDKNANAANKWNKVDSPDVKSASIEISNNTLVPKEKPNKEKDSNRSLSNYHIVIDPGHGGKDAGAIGIDGVYEKELTLSTAKQVAKELHNDGATVTLTRSNDSFISLDKRVQISNNNKTNVFISLHYNAFDDPTVKGINTFYYSGKEGHKLAKSIQSSLIDHVNLSDRGAKQANYYVLRNNNNLAILVELGFITNPNELDKIQTTDYQKKVSKGISEGLKDYFYK